MKRRTTLAMILASLIAAWVSAATPKPSASPKTTATIPAPKSTPTAKPTPEDLPSPSFQAAAVPPSTPQNQNPPKPVLYLLRTEPFTTGGKNWVRYRYD